MNLGIGMPEGIASVAAEEHIISLLTLTAEPGAIGGMPTGGLDFGSAVNAHAILDQPSQFDFYDGGGLDAAFLGMAQADRLGNVNVSRFGPKLAGSGGFINISQNAKRVVFLGTFVAPSRSQVQDGRLVIADGVTAPKFLADVEQRTFSGEYAATTGQPVLYVTERCVFRAHPRRSGTDRDRPGIDLEKDVLAHVGFEPIIDGEPKLMDARLFRDEPMGLKDDLLTVPLEARFAYDADRNIFFLNMEGMSVISHDDVEAIVAEVDKRSDRGRQEGADRRQLRQLLPGTRSRPTNTSPVVRRLAERYYASVTRYTTSSFLRLKLSEQLSHRGLAPHIYESRQEADVTWSRRMSRESSRSRPAASPPTRSGSPSRSSTNRRAQEVNGAI